MWRGRYFTMSLSLSPSHSISASLSHPPLPLPQVAKWIHFSGSGGKGSKRKRSGPKVNFKEVRPCQAGFI